ncbi:phosphorothioated DNA-binding restriction endonuclease [Candidatus Palauibacter sp.]|uniref:phosphorothioated DNA-binding restriction endonuclease n=1 Tax=Candidatus Palauibacter sp. TaxID=3101350 RepID=UPI003B025A95
MTPGEFLRHLAQLNTHTRRGRRAPHKPLLLLFALGRVLRDRDRLVGYAEVDRRVGDLMRRFGLPGSAVRPQYPFRWLLSDGLWEIPRYAELRKNASGDLYVRQLRDLGVEGGFPERVHDLLRADPGLAWRAAEEILHGHFPESLHREIREAAGIRGERMASEAEDASAAPTLRERELGPPSFYSYLARRRRRDPLFRGSVLDEYMERCAVCELDIRLGAQPLGLEAAHIQWHSHAGPDEVVNGLALCLLHHEAFDRGALGLEERKGTGFNVLVSHEVRESRGEAAGSLIEFSGRRIRSPRTASRAPAPLFVEWHSREVFRSPPL